MHEAMPWIASNNNGIAPKPDGRHFTKLRRNLSSPFPFDCTVLTQESCNRTDNCAEQSCDGQPSGCRLLTVFELEGDLHLRPVTLHLAVHELHVEFRDAGHA